MSGRCAVVLGAVLGVAGSARAEPSNAFASNSVYAQWIGSAQTYTLNYERRVLAEVFARVGFSYISARDVPWIRHSDVAAKIDGASLWQFPIELSYLGIRHHHHALELGAGATITYVGHAGAADAAGVYALGTVGYRYQSSGATSFQFRIGAELAYGSAEPHELAFGAAPYVSVGAAF